jgi:hypothetical protein
MRVHPRMAAAYARRRARSATVVGVGLLFLVPADVVVEHLRAMVHTVRSRGAVPLLGTVFVAPDQVGGFWRLCADRINVAMRALDVQRVDFAAAMGNRWDELTVDGLHPNARGVDVLAQRAREALLASRE